MDRLSNLVSMLRVIASTYTRRASGNLTYWVATYVVERTPCSHFVHVLLNEKKTENRKQKQRRAVAPPAVDYDVE